MMKVKIFNSSISIKEIEDEMNKFIEESDVRVMKVFTTFSPMHDLFHDGSVLNQWVEYTIVLVYVEPDHYIPQDVKIINKIH